MVMIKCFNLEMNFLVNKMLICKKTNDSFFHLIIYFLSSNYSMNHRHHHYLFRKDINAVYPVFKGADITNTARITKR